MAVVFPGVDPYIESQAWRDFHLTFIVQLRQTLTELLPSRYFIRIDERVYLEHAPEERPPYMLPDVGIFDKGEDIIREGKATPVLTKPAVLTLPIPERVEERFLVIRDLKSHELVTVIEILSPTNKRMGSDGRTQYLLKREEILQSWSTHLVEIDLLRGGARLPTNEGLPPADYYALVSRCNRRPQTEVYWWTPQEPLPAIPIPLTQGDPDVPLELQTFYQATYTSGKYWDSINYSRPVAPAADPETDSWIHERVKQLQ